MKRFLPLLSFALLISAVVSAQEHGIRYGVTGGVNVSSYSMHASGMSLDADSRVGFNVGFKVEMGAAFILDGFYFDGSLLLSSKGAEFNTSVDGEAVNNIVRPYYLEIPLHIGYRHTVGKSGNVSLFGTFGPYFAVGIGGKNKLESGNTTEKFDTFGSQGGLNRFDFGLGIRGGVQLYDHYQIFLGYDWGLIDIAKSNDIGYKLNTRNFYVGVAYMF